MAKLRYFVRESFNRFARARLFTDAFAAKNAAQALADSHGCAFSVFLLGRRSPKHLCLVGPTKPQRVA
jgi:hypothetical protein